MPDSDTAPALDDETTAALTLFNEYVEADRERTQREKKIKKAERTKDDAAAALKKLSDRASAEDKAEAEEAYRVAADRWKKLRGGEDPDEGAAEEAPAEEAPAEEAPAEEAPAEEAPAEEAPAEEAAVAKEATEEA
jgi:small subunit ribosomal protein S16